MEAPGLSGTSYLDGPVPLRVEVGVGLRAGALELGPYLGLALGWYVHRDQNPQPPGLASAPIQVQLHDWFGVGLRGSYRIDPFR